MAKVVVGGGPGSLAPGGRWVAGALAVGGTFLMVYAISPGLRRTVGPGWTTRV